MNTHKFNELPWAFFLFLMLFGLPCTGMAASVTKTFDLEGFTSISVFAPCDVNVIRGDDFLVEVTVDEDHANAIDVYKVGSTLVMDLQPGKYQFDTLQANVTMPALGKFEIVGTSDSTLSGFNQEELTIGIVGTGHVHGHSMQINDLSVRIIGTGGLDFGDTGPSQSAHVNLDGVIEITLNMDIGSSITGYMTGLTKLRYWGTNVDLEVAMTGLSKTERLGDTKNASPPDAFRINPGLNDAWYNPATSGQGFFISVFPDLNEVSLAWFTYDTDYPAGDAEANLGDPGHRWLTALGPISGNQSVMNIYITSGGLFDTATEIQETSPPGSDGTITLTFDGCNSGTVEYDLPAINRHGIVPIQRVASDNIALCNESIGRMATAN